LLRQAGDIINPAKNRGINAAAAKTDLFQLISGK